MTNDEIRLFRDQFKYLEKKIEEYDHIVIYRHVSPDFDALGAQMGLYQWIKDNYPTKEVHYVGDKHPTFMPTLFPYPEEVPENFYDQEHLAITVDVSNKPRISMDHIGKAKEVIKIDHHPLPQKEEQFGDYVMVWPSRPAASEILALFTQTRKRKLHLSKEAARYFYCGIVGDTGRFMYQDTDAATLRIAADLLMTGFDKTALYDQMYETDVRRLNILRYCLNNYHLTDKGVCYYVLSQKTMDELKMTIDEGNLHINTFRNLKGVRVVASITEDVSKHEWRVSLRSAGTFVASVATKFGGGGHDFAAGCKLTSLDQLPAFIAACDALK
jgi:phosphoesterase RecJ-like protein